MATCIWGAKPRCPPSALFELHPRLVAGHVLDFLPHRQVLGLGDPGNPARDARPVLGLDEREGERRLVEELLRRDGLDGVAHDLARGGELALRDGGGVALRAARHRADAVGLALRAVEAHDPALLERLALLLAAEDGPLRRVRVLAAGLRRVRGAAR